jgi:hypothetical protein
MVVAGINTAKTIQTLSNNTKSLFVIFFYAFVDDVRRDSYYACIVSLFLNKVIH